MAKVIERPAPKTVLKHCRDIGVDLKRSFIAPFLKISKTRSFPPKEIVITPDAIIIKAKQAFGLRL